MIATGLVAAAPGLLIAPSLVNPVTAKIHHYNICNAKREACTIGQAAAARDVLVYLSKSDGAWFISINEICISTFRTLATRLGDGESSVGGTFVVSRQDVTNCGNQEFGNAIFHPGGVRQDGRAWFLPNPGKDCTHPVTECRTMLCLKLNTFAGPMGQCTAHLGGANESETVDQAGRYFANAAGYMEKDAGFQLEYRRVPSRLDRSPHRIAAGGRLGRRRLLDRGDVGQCGQA